jgi:hypothetical protein
MCSPLTAFSHAALNSAGNWTAMSDGNRAWY